MLSFFRRLIIDPAGRAVPAELGPTQIGSCATLSSSRSAAWLGWTVLEDEKPVEENQVAAWDFRSTTVPSLSNVVVGCVEAPDVEDCDDEFDNFGSSVSSFNIIASDHITNLKGLTTVKFDALFASGHVPVSPVSFDRVLRTWPLRVC